MLNSTSLSFLLVRVQRLLVLLMVMIVPASPAVAAVVQAPGFRPELDWINTKGPVRLADLRGKFVLVNFWTYGNVQCQAGIVELKRLASEYPDEVVVVGIHSGKFNAERKTQNVRKAVLRHAVSYPVCNDDDHRSWSDFNIDAWPTTILIDPDGVEMFRQTGVPLYDVFKNQIERFRNYYRKKMVRRGVDLPYSPTATDSPGLLTGFGPLVRKISVTRTAPSLPVPVKQQESLFFPTAVLIDEKSGTLFVADTGHHRIVLTNLNGAVKDIIGSGEEGEADLEFSKATFQDPAGLALDNGFLYIADRSNNRLRRADLAKRQVMTVAGGEGQSPGLRSGALPWGLAIDKKYLYLALAGANQIQKFDLAAGQLRSLAGRGREDVQDGPSEEASFAQPSGIAVADEMLYVLDSQSSAVRQINLLPKGEVSTLIGVNRFEFGDQDGPPEEALLQYPTGGTLTEEGFVFCDTYNNKLKILDLVNKKVTRLAGDGKNGFLDGPFESAQFSEPQGVVSRGQKLYVADTDNHAIRVLDLEQQQVSTLSLIWPDSFHQRFKDTADSLAAKKIGIITGKDVQNVPWRRVQSNKVKRVQLLLHLPLGCRLNPAKVSQVRFFSLSGQLIKSYELISLETSFPVFRDLIEKKLLVELVLYYQDANRPSLDYYKKMILDVNLREGAPEDIFLEVAPLTYENFGE